MKVTINRIGGSIRVTLTSENDSELRALNDFSPERYRRFGFHPRLSGQCDEGYVEVRLDPQWGCSTCQDRYLGRGSQCPLCGDR